MNAIVKEVLESREKMLIGQVRRNLTNGREAIDNYLGYTSALVDIGQLEGRAELGERIGHFAERVYKLQ